MNLEQELQTLENLTQFSFEKELGQLLAGAPSSPSNSVSGGEYPQPKEKGGSTKGGFNFDLHQSETRDEVYIRKYGV